MDSQKYHGNFCKKELTPADPKDGSGGEVKRTHQLGRLKYELPVVLAHMDCRRYETVQAKVALDKDRLVWLVSEHGMGGDDFLAVLQSSQDASNQELFRLDLGAFEGLVDDLHALQTIIAGGDVAHLCDELTKAGAAYLLLDNVKPGTGEDGQRRIFNGVKEVAQTVLDYCPEIKVIIRSPLPFEMPTGKAIHLAALDEPECKVYVELHPNRENVRAQDIKSGALYSHTAGHPGRIDKLLKELAVTSLENIAHGSSDQAIDQWATLPDAQIEIIESLREGDEYDHKVYTLLTVLVVFKAGESFRTVRQFGGGLKLRSTMVSDLVRLGLAEIAETYELGVKAGEQEKIVLIKPAVQQYVFKLMGETILQKYYEDAVAVYFGKDWLLGEYGMHSGFRFADQRLYSIVEQNAVFILGRVISDAIESVEDGGREKQILDRIRVFHYYLLRLANSSKYLHVVRLGGALLPILEDYNDHNLVRDIRYHYARGLRMLSDHEESIQQSELLLEQTNSASIVASTYINMAYCYESLREVDMAKEMAQKVLDMKIKNVSSYHARGILIGLSDDAGKYQKLKLLASKARRDNHFFSSNTLRLELIAQLGDPLDQMEEYKGLSESARKEGDIYNSMRAAVEWMDIAVEYGRSILKKDFEVLMTAYKYACSQRQRYIFRQSHSVLWELLEQNDQVESLLQLFRHSSTLQRLTDRSADEQKYLQRLVRLAKKIGLEQVVRSSDSGTLRYFAARASSHGLLNVQQLRLIQ